MGNTQNIKVDSGTQAGRIDIFLVNEQIFESRNIAQEYIASGKVLVNNKPIKKNRILEIGDCVSYEPYVEYKNEVLPEDIPLNVRFEDENMLVISKQSGLICHPTSKHNEHTLVNALLYKFGKEGLSDIDDEFARYGVVHRLDANTSGLMMCAKTDECAHALIGMLRNHEIDRRYICLVHGQIRDETGMIDVPLMRNKEIRNKRQVGYGYDSKDAITTFNIIKRFESNGIDSGYTLIECKLHTGRTHQIRVHMEYIGHPVVGDILYNKGLPKQKSIRLGLRRQFLHSFYLSLTEPITGDDIEIKDRLAPELIGALSKINDRCIYECENIADYEDLI